MRHHAAGRNLAVAGPGERQGEDAEPGLRQDRLRRRELVETRKRVRRAEENEKQRTLGESVLQTVLASVVALEGEVGRARRRRLDDLRRQAFLETANRQRADPVDEMPTLLGAQRLAESRHAAFGNAGGHPPEEVADRVLENMVGGEIGRRHAKRLRSGTVALAALATAAAPVPPHAPPT